MAKETIVLGCKCGATFQMECNQFIYPGGRHDDKHHVFIAELRAEEWLDRHQNCVIDETSTKLVGAIDMIRETLDGGNVQDLKQIINSALAEYHESRA